MTPFPFVDAQGWEWHVYDYVVIGSGAAASRRSLAIGDRTAEHRAFVPVGRRGPVMVYLFNHGSWHGTEGRTLESQLYYSKPLQPADDRTSGG